MAPIFKTTSGLPLAVYIEPSSPNGPALRKSILANGGAPFPRIDKANVILVDAQTRNGRKCAREQLASNSERVVLFVEWIEACISAGKLLGDDLDWGNLRIQDPEIIDESLYEDGSQANIKSDVKEEDSKDHRPWPTPTSPTRPIQGDPPVPSGVLPRNATPKAKAEIFDPIAGPSNHVASPQASPKPRLSGSPSLKSSKAPSPIPPNYGQLPTEPGYNSLFLSACEEWENIKKDAGTYVPPPKRKSLSYERHVSLDQSTSKSPRHSLSHEQPSRSPDPSSVVYQPLAKKRRPPLPAGSTKRGPKRRASYAQEDEFTSSQLLLPQSPSQSQPIELADDSDDILEIPAPHTQSPTSRNPKKLFTYVDEPMQFSLQTDLPNRVAVIRLIRKHGGTTATRMEDASYIIVSKSMPQYQETVQEAVVVDRVAVPVAWVNRCIEENRIVSTDNYAVATGQKAVGTLTDEEIVKAAMADNPPPPAPSSSWVKHKDRGYRFTEHDREFLQKSLAWTYARDPGFLLSEFLRRLARESPHHSFNSWAYYYYRPNVDVSRILNVVKALKS